MIRILYVSRTDEKTFEENKAILTESFANNQKKKISGVLIYGMGFFIQCLEGEDAMVLELYNKIIKDARHYDVQCIFQESISQRHFPQWHMSLLNLNAYKMVSDKATFNPYAFSDEELMSFIDKVSQFV